MMIARGAALGFIGLFAGKAALFHVVEHGALIVVQLCARRTFWLPRVRWRLSALVASLVCCTVVHLFLKYGPVSEKYSAVDLSLVQSTESTTLQTLLKKTSVPDIKWKTCPSENELRTQQHFNQWDEKLAQQLRVSPQNTLKTEHESWHAVTPDIYIFSAFLVTTEYRGIHVISLVRNRINEKDPSKAHPSLLCVVRSPTGTREYTARIKVVWTWFDPPFKNALILCQPPEEEILADGNTEVAVTARAANAISLRWLPLHIPSDKADKKCCAVCVRPTFGATMSLWKLVEFVAHYRLVGARSFYFYEIQMTADAKLLLGALQAAGVDITVVTFPLLLNSSDVHAQGQMPGLYDCIFRSMSKVEYFIHVDFDEFMLPLRNSSISAIIEGTERKHGENDVGSIVVKSRYYCAEYPINSHYWSNSRVPLQTVTFNYHSIDLHQSGFTKYIGRSRAICNAGVHSVIGHCGRAREKRVEASVALLNHYRRCCAFTAKDDAVRFKVPLWNVSHVVFDEPFEEYLSDIESDVAIRTMRGLLTDV